MTNRAGNLAYLGYRTGSVLANAFPERVAGPAATLAGRALRPMMGERRQMLRRHLRRALGPEATEGDLDRALDKGFDSYARYWFEIFRLGRTDPRSLAGRLTVEGLEHVDAAMAGGRGVLVATPHLGNWDLGGAWFAQQGYRPITVVEPIEPPALFEWFVSLRRRLGVEVVALGDDTGRTLLRALADGRMVGLVCDRDLTGRGVDVDFFGERTTLPGGPATLALRARVELLTAAAYFTECGPHHCVVHPPIDTTRAGRLSHDVARITAAMAGELEALIRHAPEQWHLLQPNWPSDHELI